MNKGIYLKTADIYLRFPEIMEEECNDLAEFLEDEHIVYEGATDIVYNLQQENQRLKEELKYTVPIVEHNKIVSKKLKENQELKKQYCERTDCSGRLGNSKKVDQLEKELEQLKEIEKEHQKINGSLHLEIKELKDRIDNIVEIIEKEIESLKDKKRMIMQILTPENGYLKTDVEYEIKRLERYLEILKGDKE